MGKHIRDRGGNGCAQQQGRAGPVRGLMRDDMHQYRGKKPHQKKTGDGPSQVRGMNQAATRGAGWDFYD
jgi:hypothetical protein